MLTESSPGDAGSLADAGALANDLPYATTLVDFQREQLGWWCLVAAQAVVVIVLFILFIT